MVCEYAHSAQTHTQSINKRYFENYFKGSIIGAGEKSQWLRAVAALEEDLVPSTHSVTHNCNSSPRGSDVFFWPPQALA